MKSQLRFGVFLSALGAIAVLLLTLPVSQLTVTAAPPLSGAIFTTNMNGTRVNQNHFNDKCEVYLDGGPGPNAPQGAAGLPDGDYYFQVTDPSGKTLLSTDPVANRQFNVSGGIITGNSGLGNHVTGMDVDHGAATIQLCPFLDTPNPGGVYKVWVTPVGDFVGDPNMVDNPCGRGCFHGFIPAASKTDNFKVRAEGANLPCIGVFKFHQLNVNHALNPWPITIFGPLGEQINGQLYSSEAECLVFNLEPGWYRVVEGPTRNPAKPEVFVVMANIVDGRVLPHPDLEVLVHVKRGDGVHTVGFGNREIPSE